MRIVAEAACAEGETIHNMPGGATPDQVYAALLVADQYGQRFLQEWNNTPNSPACPSLNVKLPDATLIRPTQSLQYSKFTYFCRPDKAFTPHPARCASNLKLPPCSVFIRFWTFSPQNNR